MKKEEKANIESFLVDLDDLYLTRMGFDDLTGRKSIKRILLGALPYYDSDNISFNFSELYSTNVVGNTSSNMAFLFFGKPGNGKKTLEYAFIFHVIHTIEDEMDEDDQLSDYIKYYKLDLFGSDFEVEDIDSLFDSFLKMTESEDSRDKYILLSLGNMTENIENSEKSQLVAERIDRILANDKVTCIVTGYCHKSEKELPAYINNSFMTIYLDSPNNEEREEYFVKAESKYPNISWGVKPAVLSKLTHDFTYSMLDKVNRMVLMLAKETILSEELQLIHYIAENINPDIRSVVIEEREINDIVDNVRNSFGLNKDYAGDFFDRNQLVDQLKYFDVHEDNWHKENTEDVSSSVKKKDGPQTFAEFEERKEKLIVPLKFLAKNN